MLYRIKTVDGVKTKVPLAGSTPAGLPVGSILTTYKKIQPYNYLYCDGSTFDETQYPELYLYLGTNVLPDYRECVPVGAEKNTTDIFDSTETDPSTGLPGTQSHDVFTQGQFKDDQFQRHEHYINSSRITPHGMGLGGGAGQDYGAIYYGSRNEDIWAGTIKAGRTGTTTRTKEKAVYYYIKAVDGVDIADEDTFLNTVVNTIQGAQSYSTDEVATGGKWIDGKDIYRKVLGVGAVSTGGSKIIAHNVANFSEYTHIEGIVKTSNSYFTLPFSAVAATSYNIQVQMTATDVGIYCAPSINIDSGFIVIEYTKTTD